MYVPKDHVIEVNGTEVYHLELLQWRAAIKLEILGMRHSSGRSVAAHARRRMGLPKRGKKQEVLDVINDILQQYNEYMGVA